MDKFTKLLVSLFLLLTLTGCWDKVEIDQRAFISAIGIDVFESKDTSNEENGNIKEPKESPSNIYTVTYVFPNLDAVGKDASSDEPRFVMSSVGQNPFDISRGLTTRLNRVIFYGHLDVVIFGEKLARNPEYMREILDALDRHNEIGRRIVFAIVKGTAKDAIAVESEFDPVTGTFLAGVMEKEENAARFPNRVLGEILQSLHNDGNALAPRITPSESELKMAGAAIIKDYRLIGWLGELENRAVMFIRDEVEAEITNVEVEGATIPFIITESKTTKSASASDENIKVNIEIEMEGYIQQYKLGTGNNILDDKLIKTIEEAVAKRLEKQILGTVDKLQKEFKVDVLGINDYLSKFEPALWRKVEKDWDKIFPTIDITVNIDAKLRRVGMTR